MPCHVCRMGRARLGIAAARGCSESRVEEAVGTEVQVSNYAGARTWGRETSELGASREGVRELLEGLKELRGAGSREGAIRRVAEVAGKGDV